MHLRPTQPNPNSRPQVISVNLTAAFLLARAAGAHMLPHREGKIILLASLLTYQGGLTVPAYASAKGGVGQLVKALANEWSAHNVHVNALVPGYVDTDMNAALLSDPLRRPQIDARIPAGRWGAPADFAGPAVFLASRASQYVCGELLVVDGVRSTLFRLFVCLFLHSHSHLHFQLAGLDGPIEIRYLCLKSKASLSLNTLPVDV
jgi:short-subunit dehydrogenase